MKKILFLFAHLHKGGMQRAVSNITQALGDEYELHVAYFGTENPGFKYNAIMHDLKIPGSLNNSLFDKSKKYLRRLIVLKNFVNNNKFDTVVSFGESANLLNLLSNHNSRKILSVRVSIDEGLGGGLYATISKLLIKFFYKKADLIVAVSKKLQQDCLKIVGDKIPVIHIPNMYPIDEIKRKAQEPLPKEFQYLENEKYIINVGSYCYQKGQDLLIKAYANNFKLNSEYKLVLLGRGPDKEKLLKLTEELNLIGKVIFIDFQSNPYNFIKKSTLFVLSSRYEGFPNVLMEAMICGKVTVSFDCPTGPREIMADGTYGVLVKKINYTSLSEAIVDIVSDYKRIPKIKELLNSRVKQFDYHNISMLWKEIL